LYDKVAKYLAKHDKKKAKKGWYIDTWYILLQYMQCSS
jgi:hypothetical protein